MRYLKTWVDKKTGIPYAKFRRRGYADVMLHVRPIGSAEFMVEFFAALNGKALPDDPAKIGASRLKPGSVGAVVGLFLESSSFTAGKSEGTQRRRRSVLNGFREEHGDKLVALCHRQFVEQAIDDLGGSHAARNWLKAMRPFFEFCVKQGFIESDPTLGIKIKVPKSDGHRTWEEEHIAQYRAYWIVGTMERLAMELALNIGQRVSDLVRVGRQNRRGGVIKIKQKKTTRHGNMVVEVPVHPELAAVLDVPPATENMTYLVNAWGRPFTDNGFSKWFSDAAQKAGLPEGYTAHGLRKGFCKRLADQGCDAKEIAAMSGHLTLAEVQHYCEAYDRRKAARSGMAKLIAGTT